MKKFMMIAALMVVAVTASAQRSPGDQTLKPFVGFNLANFAGDINDNSIKFAIAAGAEYERQLTDLIALSAGAVFSWQVVNSAVMLVLQTFRLTSLCWLIFTLFLTWL